MVKTIEKEIISEVKGKRKISEEKKIYGRQRYFQIQIYWDLGWSKTNLRINSINLIPLLVANKFLSVSFLEKQLYNFAFEYEGKEIQFLNFEGQLERKKENGAPFWNILVETTAGVTAKQLAFNLSAALYKSKGEEIDPRLKVKALLELPELQELNKEDKFLTDHPKWSPSFFGKKYFETRETLITKKFYKMIEERPQKFSYFIKSLLPLIEKLL